MPILLESQKHLEPKGLKTLLWQEFQQKNHICTEKPLIEVVLLWVMLGLNLSIFTHCWQMLHLWASLLAPLKFYWDGLGTRVGFSPLIQHLQAKVQAAYWGPVSQKNNKKRSACIFQTVLKLRILLLQHPQCWEHRHGPPYLIPF